MVLTVTIMAERVPYPLPWTQAADSPAGPVLAGPVLAGPVLADMGE